MKKYIGGFAELELFQQPGPGYHAGALALTNARACISHLLLQTQARLAWVPYYTCNAMLQPFEQLGVPYRFYALDSQLEPETLPFLAKDELFLYINFFGLKNACIHRLATHFGDALVVDNTQDFFAHDYAHGWAFNSARKSFGVPDGGYLYGPAAQLGTTDDYPLNTDYQVAHLVDRLRGAQAQAYAEFVAYETTLTSQTLRVSEMSAALLSQVNYAEVKARRQENFRHYHQLLGNINTLPVSLELELHPSDTVPFCYPLLLPANLIFDRTGLYQHNIFVPTLWPDVLTRLPAGFMWERYLTTNLLALPLDHRYTAAEVVKVAQVLRTLLSAN